MSAASDNLRDHQGQLDMDGVEVRVSRQSVYEVLEQHAELLAALKFAVENIQGIADETDIPSTAIRELARAAIAKAEAVS